MAATPSSERARFDAGKATDKPMVTSPTLQAALVFFKRDVLFCRGRIAPLRVILSQLAHSAKKKAQP
jgi:hypothetical protein